MSGHAPWREVWVPKSFVRYACERQLVCCSAPVRAPIDVSERLRITEVLSASEAGRAIVPTLPAAITLGMVGGHVWRQTDGRCANLTAEPACRLQVAGGFHALPSACRNFPRWVTQIGDRLEVVFALSCPTAARLLVEGAGEPFAWVAAPALEAWTYLPTRTAPSAIELATPAPLEALMDLRAAWWALLAGHRHSASALLQVLGALLVTPLAPPTGQLPPIPEALGEPLAVPASHRVVDCLGATSKNGAYYRDAFWPAFEALLDPLTPRALTAKVEAAPEILEAFVAHELAWAGLHDHAPIADHFILTVRRAILALRLTDALLTHVPLATATLFRDAFAITPFFDP